MGSKTVRLEAGFVELAKRVGSAMRRSTPQQIEHWAEIGRIMEDNPDLPYAFVRDAMLAQTEREAGLLEEYTFG